jgi:hypothetical protein
MKNNTMDLEFSQLFLFFSQKLSKVKKPMDLSGYCAKHIVF